MKQSQLNRWFQRKPAVNCNDIVLVEDTNDNEPILITDETSSTSEVEITSQSKARAAVHSFWQPRKRLTAESRLQASAAESHAWTRAHQATLGARSNTFFLQRQASQTSRLSNEDEIVEDYRVASWTSIKCIEPCHFPNQAWSCHLLTEMNMNASVSCSLPRRVETISQPNSTFTLSMTKTKMKPDALVSHSIASNTLPSIALPVFHEKAIKRLSNWLKRLDRPLHQKRRRQLSDDEYDSDQERKHATVAILCGPLGVGKSYLRARLCPQAMVRYCQYGDSVRHIVQNILGESLSTQSLCEHEQGLVVIEDTDHLGEQGLLQLMDSCRAVTQRPLLFVYSGQLNADEWLIPVISLKMPDKREIQQYLTFLAIQKQCQIDEKLMQQWFKERFCFRGLVQQCYWSLIGRDKQILLKNENNFESEQNILLNYGTITDCCRYLDMQMVLCDSNEHPLEAIETRKDQRLSTWFQLNLARPSLDCLSNDARYDRTNAFSEIVRLLTDDEPSRGGRRRNRLIYGMDSKQRDQLLGSLNII